jgi:AraC-like DNA-binding protein
MFILTFSAQLIFLFAASEMVQGIFLAALLYFHPKTDKSVNGFLSLYIICVCILLLIPAVQQLFSSEAILYLMPFPLLIGPFLYLYVRSFKETITWRKAWPHFVLFFIFLILDYFFLPSWVNKYPSQKDSEQALLNPASNIRIIIRTIRNVQMIVYYFLAQRTLTSYQKSITHLFSDISKIDLAWARWLINGYLFLIISLLALFYFVVQYPDQFELVIVINTTVITPYIYLITFKGLTQPTLWQTAANGQRDKLEKEIREAAEIEASKKDKKKNEFMKQQENRSEQIVSRITEKMQNEKLYQETELTLQNLADSIGFPSYQVSQAINERMNKNFYDLVNGCRVEEAKRLLLDPKNKNFTILSIGFEAGFNSKTTFNTIFKKFTGLTPTAFKDKQQQAFVSL